MTPTHVPPLPVDLPALARAHRALQLLNARANGKPSEALDVAICKAAARVLLGRDSDVFRPATTNLKDSA